jgi:hypothetical protein
MDIAESLANFQEEAMDYIENQTAQMNHLSDSLEAERKYNYGVREQAIESARERDAVLTTLKLLQGNQGPSSSVYMGEKRDRG